jgi:hypothetical protein
MEKLLFRRSSAVPGSMTQESVHNNTSVTRRLDTLLLLYSLG